jgi:hypothetical protein
VQEKEKGGERAMTGYNLWERDVYRSYLTDLQDKHEKNMKEKQERAKKNNTDDWMEASE